MKNILINQLQNHLKENKDTIDYQISKYLLSNLNNIKKMTIKEVAQEANCSIASVTKFSRRLGLDGFKELIQVLNLEASILVPQLTLENDLDFESKDQKLIDRYYEMIQTNLEYLHNNSSREIINAVNLICTSQKIFLFGKGANLNPLMIFANYLLKLDYRTNFSFDFDVQQHFANNVRENDLCFIFSYSGITEEVVEIYQKIKEKHAKIILITSNQYSLMYSEENINLFVLKNEEVQKEQRNSVFSSLFIIMEIIYLLSN